MKKITAAPSLAYPAVAAAIILAAASFATAILVRRPAEDALEGARRGEPLRIGYALLPPNSFVAADGEITGEAPAIARRAASALGIERIEWRRVEFNSLLTALNARRIDVVAAGMFITPERAEQASFSEPTFRALEGLLVRAGNPLGIHSYRQAVEMSGVRIAALLGSDEHLALVAPFGFSRDDMPDGVSAAEVLSWH